MLSFSQRLIRGTNIRIFCYLLIFLSGEIIAGLSPEQDGISHLAHIIGGLCGTAFGWAVTKPKAEGGSEPPAAPSAPKLPF